MTQTKLDTLNNFLKNPELDLPPIRRKVDRQGSNMQWLRKHLHVRNTVPEDIQKLLSTDVGRLVKETA